MPRNLLPRSRRGSKAQSNRPVSWGTKARGQPLPCPPHLGPSGGSSTYGLLGTTGVSSQIVGSNQEGLGSFIAILRLSPKPWHQIPAQYQQRVFSLQAGLTCASHSLTGIHKAHCEGTIQNYLTWRNVSTMKGSKLEGYSVNECNRSFSETARENSLTKKKPNHFTHITTDTTSKKDPSKT